MSENRKPVFWRYKADKFTSVVDLSKAIFVSVQHHEDGNSSTEIRFDSVAHPKLVFLGDYFDEISQLLLMSVT